MESLDLNYARSFFPALGKEWVFMDNAGGTQTARPVAERISDYLLHTNVQLGATYEVSVRSGSRVAEAQTMWARAINASHPSEVAFGSSTTMLLQSLSRSLEHVLQPGDEVIVTNCDHEANIGPWLRLQDKGIVVKSWDIDPESYTLQLKRLEKLMTRKTRLVAFTHVSNILGTINPVKEITRFVHDRGAMVCVDGVAYAPHRLVDVSDWDVDFYVFSLYKVYGPHYALLYGKQELFEKLPGINHFFIDEVPYKLQPGNVNFELSYGSLGIIDYLAALGGRHAGPGDAGLHKGLGLVFDWMAIHEEALSEKLLGFLDAKPSVRIIGERTAGRDKRVPTISFVVDRKKSSDITREVAKARIGIRYGDFYARRLIEGLGLTDVDGVVRVSMVHYNTTEETDRLIRALDPLL